MIISIYHGFFVCIFLFILGTISLLMRKNLLFILISLEIMTNAVALLIVLSGNYWHQLDGQIMYIFIITIAAADLSVALSILLQIYKKYKTLDIYKLNEMNK